MAAELRDVGADRLWKFDIFKVDSARLDQGAVAVADEGRYARACCSRRAGRCQAFDHAAEQAVVEADGIDIAVKQAKGPSPSGDAAGIAGRALFERCAIGGVLGEGRWQIHLWKVAGQALGPVQPRLDPDRSPVARRADRDHIVGSVDPAGLEGPAAELRRCIPIVKAHSRLPNLIARLGPKACVRNRCSKKRQAYPQDVVVSWLREISRRLLR